MKNKKAGFIVRTVTIFVLVAVLIVAIGCAVYSGVNSYIFKLRMDYVKEIPVADADVDNAILMIGDGMGANHIKAAKAASKKEFFSMDSLPLHGEVTTFSQSGTTDSAAAATAMSTGVKIINGGVSMQNGENLETLAEYARKQGKSVGIICTETLTGATPSGFSAHANNRGDTDILADSQLASGIDLFIGAGKSYFDKREAKIEAAGYEYVTSFSELDADAEKIFASFDSVTTGESTDSAPRLAELAAFAMDYLDAKDTDGYFLMIEGSHIDKKSHSNDMSGMIAELLAFDSAVETVLSKAELDTYVMVTADHETGGLRYNGEKGEAINDGLFSSGGHTGANVRYFATAQVRLLPVIDNTNIAKVFRELLAA